MTLAFIAAALLLADAAPTPVPAATPAAVAAPAATVVSVCANSADGATNGAIAVAGDGTVYAATGYHVVRRFDPGARGNVAPSASLCTAFGSVGNIDALAAMGDSLYVVSDGAIRQFARTASESQEPLKLIGSATNTDNASGLTSSEGGPQQLAIGSDKTVYVLFSQHAHGGCSAVVDVFAPSEAGDVGPVSQLSPAVPGFPRTVDGRADCATPSSIAVDVKSQLYTVFTDGTIVRSAPPSLTPGVRVAAVRPASSLYLALGRAGNLYVAGGRTITIVNLPKRGAANVTISGPKTGLDEIAGLAVDDTGTMYALNCSRAGAALLVFAPNASGNAAPISKLAGPDTRMTCAYRR